MRDNERRRKRTANSGQQTANSKQQTADSGQRTADSGIRRGHNLPRTVRVPALSSRGARRLFERTQQHQQHATNGVGLLQHRRDESSAQIAEPLRYLETGDEL